jgi:hypothetical protein
LETERLEDLHNVLAAERSDPMSDNNDRSASDESFGRSDAEPIDHDIEEMGFSVDSDGRLVWEEVLDYHPNSEWCRQIDAKIEADDQAFLTACGILAEDL